MTVGNLFKLIPPTTINSITERSDENGVIGLDFSISNDCISIDNYKVIGKGDDTIDSKQFHTCVGDDKHISHKHVGGFRCIVNFFQSFQKCSIIYDNSRDVYILVNHSKVGLFNALFTIIFNEWY